MIDPADFTIHTPHVILKHHEGEGYPPPLETDKGDDCAVAFTSHAKASRFLHNAPAVMREGYEIQEMEQTAFCAWLQQNDKDGVRWLAVDPPLATTRRAHSHDPAR
jgi:hypothetical protein